MEADLERYYTQEKSRIEGKQITKTEKEELLLFLQEDYEQKVNTLSKIPLARLELETFSSSSSETWIPCQSWDPVLLRFAKVFWKEHRVAFYELDLNEKRLPVTRIVELPFEWFISFRNALWPQTQFLPHWLVKHFPLGQLGFGEYRVHQILEDKRKQLFEVRSFRQLQVPDREATDLFGEESGNKFSAYEEQWEENRGERKLRGELQKSGQLLFKDSYVDVLEEIQAEKTSSSDNQSHYSWFDGFRASPEEEDVKKKVVKKMRELTSMQEQDINSYLAERGGRTWIPDFGRLSSLPASVLQEVSLLLDKENRQIEKAAISSLSSEEKAILSKYSKEEPGDVVHNTPQEEQFRRLEEVLKGLEGKDREIGEKVMRIRERGRRERGNIDALKTELRVLDSRPKDAYVPDEIANRPFDHTAPLIYYDTMSPQKQPLFDPHLHNEELEEEEFDMDENVEDDNTLGKE